MHLFTQWVTSLHSQELAPEEGGTISSSKRHRTYPHSQGSHPLSYACEQGTAQRQCSTPSWWFSMGKASPSELRIRNRWNYEWWQWDEWPEAISWKEWVSHWLGSGIHTISFKKKCSGVPKSFLARKVPMLLLLPLEPKSKNGEKNLN